MSKIFLGDCLESMKSMPDCSVDSIVTDPPYGMDFQSCWTEKNRRKPKIPNDKKPFIWWLHEAYRVMKTDSALICFTDWKNQEVWRTAIDAAHFQIRSHVIWDRCSHGMGDLKSSFGPQHDVIWFATKGKFKFPNIRPKSVIRSMRVSGDALMHPNEKPVDLMEQLVSAVTPTNGTVLDPFMGSGTTGVACKNLGFDFVGCEMNPEYAAIAEKRISANQVALKQRTSDGPRA